MPVALDTPITSAYSSVFIKQPKWENGEHEHFLISHLPQVTLALLR
jgi:hypothetical protein